MDKRQCRKQKILIGCQDLCRTDDIILYRCGKTVDSKFSYREFKHVVARHMRRPNENLIVKTRLEKAIRNKEISWHAITERIRIP